MIVLQHVNSNYGLKQSPGFLPIILLIFYQNAVTSYFCLLTVLAAETQEITIMFWLANMRRLFYFAASDLFLGLGHSDYVCTGQA